ncbi:hypothetical protein FDECE_5483 [Fusarium decemcellulare]|nr:hypothetical protein FDECE_5483 [Fusarium decemcellulare]
MSPEPSRERLRSHQACLNCRSVFQPAILVSICGSDIEYLGGRKPDALRKDQLAQLALTSLEEKVDLLLNGYRQGSPSFAFDQQDIAENPHEENHGSADGQLDSQQDNSQPPASMVIHCATNDTNESAEDSSPQFAFKDAGSQIPQATVSKAVDLYFELCHRQPIWCFERQDLEQMSEIPEELLYSILELTARFLPDRGPQTYGDTARGCIMQRVATGTVQLETIESLCLMSYSSFIDGNLDLGQFYLGLGFQLCRSAKMDRLLEPAAEGSSSTERRRRVFWSLQSLEAFHSEQDGILGPSPDVWRPFYVSNTTDAGFPRDSTPSTSSEMGIWTAAAHFGWAWSKVRQYVSEGSHNRLKEPWRLDSTCAKALADTTDIENKIPWSHRYESAKFHERQPEELKANRDYWIPWLKLQFTWHSILMVLNHPFLYIMASQHNANLAIPNTFWRKSSERVLLHATWIVRLIDMISEKEVQLVDPFFGHAAAIAATVHLYFCCAADPRLKQKSKADFGRCKKFVRNWESFSPACASLAQCLDDMTRIASGTEPTGDDWELNKIYLSIPLMWGVLQFKTADLQGTCSSTLLHQSLCPTDPEQDMQQSTLEIRVAVSPPEVTIDPVAGHNAGLPPYRATTTVSPGGAAMGDLVVAPTDSFMFNTPWLWADQSQFTGIENTGYMVSDPSLGNAEGFSTWWNVGNL